MEFDETDSEAEQGQDDNNSQDLEQDLDQDQEDMEGYDQDNEYEEDEGVKTKARAAAADAAYYDYYGEPKVILLPLRLSSSVANIIYLCRQSKRFCLEENLLKTKLPLSLGTTSTWSSGRLARSITCFDCTVLMFYYQNLSYLHCSYVSADYISSERMGKSRLQKFIQKITSTDEDLEPFNADYLEIDRILAQRRRPSDNAIQYLVKWKSLGYNEVSWEDQEDVRVLSCLQYKHLFYIHISH